MPRPQSQDNALTQSHEKEIAVNTIACAGAEYFLSEKFLRPSYGDAWTWFARPPMATGDLRASLLHAADYLDQALDAQIEGDDCGVVDALEVLRSIVAVVLGQISAPSSSENRVLQ
jgi:hypothetical protein